MRDEVVLPEFRDVFRGVVTDNCQNTKVIGIGRIGKFLCCIDTADISGNEVGHIAAHPAVFHNGNEAGHQQYHGYRTEAQDELHFHRKLEFTYI